MNTLLASTPAATTATSGKPGTHNGPRLTPDRIFQTGMAFWNSKILLTAAELGIFTELSHGAMDVNTLRQRLGLHPRSAHDFFDALVALGFLERHNGLYANAPEAALFLDRNQPTYVGGILEMCNARLYSHWGSLTEALRTGKPQGESKNGGDTFENLYSTPEKLEVFLKSMTGLSLGAAHAMAEKFPWAKYRSVVDVGAAQGAMPAVLAKRHPHLQASGFDLPVVEPVFASYVKAQGVADRVRFQGGDFFKEPLPSADVIIMGHILHDWDLAQKLKLIQKAYDALPAGGAFIIYEALIDDERRTNSFGLAMSLNMLIETPGGFDFTGAECQEWLRAIGFSQTRVEHLLGPESMVIAIK